MNRKSKIIMSSLMTLTLGLTLTIPLVCLNSTKNINADNQYTMIFDSTKSVDSGTTSEIFKTVDGNDINFELSNYAKEDNKFGTFNQYGYFRNKTALSGLESITVNFTGTPLAVKYGFTYGNLNTHYYLTSGTKYSFDNVKPTFFELDTFNANVSVTSIILTYTCTPETETTNLKFGIFADVQLCNDTIVNKGSDATVNLGTTANAPLALKSHLQYCKDNNFEVILMNGDITNQANTYYYDYYDRIFKSVYGTDSSTYPEVVWNMGNHEWWWGTSEKETGDAVSLFNQYANINSKYLVKRSAVPYSINPNVTIPTYYKVIKGVPILVISGENSNGTIGDTLLTELQTWLAEIKQLESVQKGGPIIVMYHYPLSTSMTHGQGSGTQAAVLENLLKDTPNAIVFTGDTHYPGINERSINQVNFTTINLGSSSYSRMVNQSAVICDDYYNVEGSGSKIGDKLAGNAKYKEAYTPTLQVVDISSKNITKINRYYTDNVRQVGNEWIIKPTLSKNNFIYTNSRFQDVNASYQTYGKNGLTWKNDDQVTYNIDSATGFMTVRFPDVNEYHYCEHYKIDVNSKTYDVVSNYYKYLDSPEYNYYVLKEIPSATSYTVKVTAYDFFDNPSLNTLSATTQSDNAKLDAIDYQSTLTYCDIQTRNNFDDVVDGNSHSSIEYYYKGIQEYKAGAILSRLFMKGDTTASCKEYISLQDDAECTPTVLVSVKNLGTEDLTVGLSVVKNNDGVDDWKDDFGTTRKTVKAGQWTTLSWDLTVYDITKRSDISQITLKARSTAATSEGYVTNFLIDNIDISPNKARDTTRFEKNVGCTVDIPKAVSGDVVTVDFKFDSNTETVGVALLHDWNNYYGYFTLSQSGPSQAYNGVSYEVLGDGFVRYSFNIGSITKMIGSPTEATKLFLQAGQCNVGGVLEVQKSGKTYRGTEFTAKKDLTKKLGTTLTSATDTLVFDVKFTTASTTFIKIMFANQSSWSNYFGYFELYCTTKTGDYVGLTVETLEDGYIRYSFKLSEIEIITGTAPTTIDFVYLWTPGTASGYIDVLPVI